MVVPRFEFATAGRVVFGIGTRHQLAALAEPLGTRYVLVRGRSTARAGELVRLLGREPVAEVSIPREPTTELVKAGVETARGAGAEWILAVGGGSVLDAGKAIAVLATNPGDPLEYLEVVGQGKPLLQAGIPCVAVPTTAGTGAEVTRNSVISVKEKRVKVSLRHHYVLPRVALVDPELTLDLPAFQTAASGLDALSQLIEGYLTHRATPLTDAICRQVLPLAAGALPLVYQNGKDINARSIMSYSALCSGLVLANAGLGAVHGLAGPLGGWLEAPHGVICGRLLPYALLINERVLRERAPEHQSNHRMIEVARWITGDESATVQDAVALLEQWLEQFGIPRLRALGLRREEMRRIANQALEASSMKANPVPLLEGEVMEILDRAY